MNCSEKAVQLFVENPTLIDFLEKDKLIIRPKMLILGLEIDSEETCSTNIIQKTLKKYSYTYSMFTKLKSIILPLIRIIIYTNMLKIMCVKTNNLKIKKYHADAPVLLAGHAFD